MHTLDDDTTLRVWVCTSVHVHVYRRWCRRCARWETPSGDVARQRKLPAAARVHRPLRSRFSLALCSSDPALATLRPFLLASPRRAGPALAPRVPCSSALMNWNRSMPGISITDVRPDNGDISAYPRPVTFNSILFLLERYGKLYSNMLLSLLQRYAISFLRLGSLPNVYYVLD